jgi:hypothetical protein
MHYLFSGFGWFVVFVVWGWFWFGFWLCGFLFLLPVQTPRTIKSISFLPMLVTNDCFLPVLVSVVFESKLARL